MAVEVVILSSDSEDEGTKEVSIISNKFAPKVGEDKKRPCSLMKRATVRAVETPVLNSKCRDSSPGERVRKRVKGRNSLPVEKLGKLVKCRDSLLAEQVQTLIKGGDWKELRVVDLRSYAREQGLIIGGTKQVLIDRIKNHIEILEGGAEKYKPKSFTIDCSGDVCVGDVVRFKQRVYYEYNISKRKSRPEKMRMVAGRVVKESYGKKRQQHTFTIEVLRSSGYRELPPMKQLRIKGRNLYKFRVRRQSWEDEDSRLAVLQEKHERGDAARKAHRQSNHPAGGAKRKRKHAEMRRKSRSVSAVRSKKRRKILNLKSRPVRCRAPRAKQPRLIVQKSKHYMKKQRNKQLSGTRDRKVITRSKTEKSREEKRRRRRQWHVAERRKSRTSSTNCAAKG